jgi:hypothetical protein
MASVVFSFPNIAPESQTNTVRFGTIPLHCSLGTLLPTVSKGTISYGAGVHREVYYPRTQAQVHWSGRWNTFDSLFGRTPAEMRCRN